MDTNPFGLHTVTPYLVIRNAVSVINFVQEVFGAALRGDIRFRENGSVEHAEVTIGDSVIMIAEPMEGVHAMPGMLYVYVENCDETIARAFHAGATILLPVADYPHGDRYGGVTDMASNVWWIVTHTGKKETV